MSNNGKLSVPDYDEIRDGIKNLRKTLCVWMALEAVTVVLFSLASIFAILGNKGAMKIIEFVGKHSIISIAASVAGAAVMIMYCVQITNLRRFNGGLIVAGILGLAMFIFSRASNAASAASTVRDFGSNLKSVYETVITNSVTNSLILLVFMAAFRKTYYTAMEEGTMELSVPVSRMWKSLWELTLIVLGCSAVVIFALRTALEHFVTKLTESSYVSYEGFTDDYNLMMVLLVLIIVVAGIADLILQFRELYCLRETADVMFPPAGEGASYRS